MKKLTLAIMLAISSPSIFAGSKCANDFSTFLDQFGDSRSFQEAHMKYPLSYTSNNGHVDNHCYPDCKTIEEKLTKQKAVNLSDPIFPLQETQLMTPLQKSIKRYNQHMIVRLDKPDSDSFSIEYTFKRYNSCWQLVTVKDMSIVE